MTEKQTWYAIKMPDLYHGFVTDYRGSSAPGSPRLYKSEERAREMAIMHHQGKAKLPFTIVKFVEEEI